MAILISGTCHYLWSLNGFRRGGYGCWPIARILNALAEIYILWNAEPNCKSTSNLIRVVVTESLFALNQIFIVCWAKRTSGGFSRAQLKMASERWRWLNPDRLAGAAKDRTGVWFLKGKTCPSRGLRLRAFPAIKILWQWREAKREN